MKDVLANLEVTLGLLMMGFLLPMVHPRYFAQGLISFSFVLFGVALMVHGIKRLLRSEKS